MKVEAVKSSDAEAVPTHLCSTTLDNMYVQGGQIRADSTMLHDIHVLQVKRPEQSTDAWDVYQLVATVPGSEAFPES